MILEILKRDKIWGGHFALASPSPNSGQRVPPSPWFTPMDVGAVSI